MDPEESSHVFGIDIGDGDVFSHQFRAGSAATRQIYETIRGFGDIGIELVFIRLCADVSKIIDLFRTYGEIIEEDALREFDVGLFTSVSVSL